jgi:hypothetical protein
MCEDFAPNFDEKITGCCITVTYRLTLLFFTREFKPKKHDCLPHPPYFALFLRLKIKLEDRNFDTVEVIEVELQAVLNTTCRMHLKMAEAP